MKPPETVEVAPFEVTVRFDRDAANAAGANGIWLSDTATIVLQEGNHPLVERDVVLHECLHAVWTQTPLDTEFPDEAADSPGERIIACLAPRLLHLLRANPALVRYLTGGPK